jgi:hypothetical protein
MVSVRDGASEFQGNGCAERETEHSEACRIEMRADSSGRLVFGILATLAEFERHLIKEHRTPESAIAGVIPEPNDEDLLPDGQKTWMPTFVGMTRSVHAFGCRDVSRREAADCDMRQVDQRIIRTETDSHARMLMSADEGLSASERSNASRHRQPPRCSGLRSLAAGLRDAPPGLSGSPFRALNEHAR